MMSLEVPKLLIQPLEENSLIHGIEKNKVPGLSIDRVPMMETDYTGRRRRRERHEVGRDSKPAAPYRTTTR